MATNFELVKSLLKPPLRITGITAEMVRPVKPQYDQQFSSLEEVYLFFRKQRPKGRWIIWIQGSDGQEMPLDSQKWEEAKKVCQKETMEWEYKTLQAGRKGDYNVIVPDERLNEMSRGGWELVTTFSTTGGRSGDEEKEKIFYIFKHPKGTGRK